MLRTVVFILIANIFLPAIVQSQRRLETDAVQLEKILNKLTQLEEKVNALSHTQEQGCTRICDDDWSKLQKGFLDTESCALKRSAPSPTSSAVACKPDEVTQCTEEGVNEFKLAKAAAPFRVLCDMYNWIVILQRFDGSVSFHDKNWEAYKGGFGNITAHSEFFLGLQHLHDITAAAPYKLLIELEDFNGIRRVAQYTQFSVGDEQSAYKLGTLGGYTGNAGDSFKYHEGQSFTTLDRDNDGKAIGSCGEEFNSAGWFNSCMEANLMGRYMRGENSNFKEGMYWETFRGPEYSLKSVKVSIHSKCPHLTS